MTRSGVRFPSAPPAPALKPLIQAVNWASSEVLPPNLPPIHQAFIVQRRGHGPVQLRVVLPQCAIGAGRLVRNQAANPLRKHRAKSPKPSLLDTADTTDRTQSLRSIGGGQAPRAVHHRSSHSVRSRVGRYSHPGWSRAAAETISGTLRAARAGPPPFSAMNS